MPGGAVIAERLRFALQANLVKMMSCAAMMRMQELNNGALLRRGRICCGFALLSCRQYDKLMWSFLGKPKPLERVNLAERMAATGLDAFFGSESWPMAAPVRELKTKIKNLTGDGFSNPLVFAELRK